MNKIFTLLALLALTAGTVNAQMTISSDTNTVQLVNGFILSGVTASNVLYTGADSTLGTFSNGNTTNLGLTNGIVMTTGKLYTIADTAAEFSSYMNNSPGDLQLGALVSGIPTYDASVLEFDLVPAGNILEFQYVFASEEYPEFVGSGFNDVFGFFINGANPTGGNYVDTNIAIIPGTNLPVAINNVNAGLNSAYYVDNLGLGGTTIVYDGFTTVLLAQIYVIPSTTYHLKMAIADVSDGIFDSGIFLKAQSMKSYNGTTGITDEKTNNFTIYPNPVKDKMLITLNEKATLEFLNAEGQLVKSLRTEAGQNSIDASDLAKGIYFVKMITEKGTTVKKFVKA